MSPGPVRGKGRAIIFFDIDNCLYTKNLNIHEHMVTLIRQYFVARLNVSSEEAIRLHQQYSEEYGLAIRGLVQCHQVDPLDFKREVDDALPLEELLHPDPQTRQILESFDTSKVKMWLLTNAHVTHGRRVVKLLNIEDLFEGITYCDYRQEELIAKPSSEMFAKAEREAGATPATTIYFVDDSYPNCRAAYAYGWTNTVHLVEPPTSAPSTSAPSNKASQYQISHLRELGGLFPELLKKTNKP